MKESLGAADWAADRGEQWRAQVDGMEAMFRAIDDPLIRGLQLVLPGRIADIGCGGGATSRELLRRAPVGSVVDGFDISPGLVALARGRAGAEAGAISFTVADAATARPARAYDRLVSRFGVMFFADPPAAFANLRGWLAPGGRFAFAVWGPLAGNAWMASVREVVAGIVELAPADPEAPGPFRYADGDRLLALLDAAGFAGLAVHDWRSALPLGGGLPPADAARFAIAAFSSFGERLAAAGEEAQAQAQRALTRRFADHQRGGAVWMDAWVRLVTGTGR